jgi:hypothetical protein
LLNGLCGGVVDLGPWFAFTDDSSIRHYCQPDFTCDLGERLVVGEIKLRWTSDAWWQLRRLYLPVLAAVYPGRTLLPVCVCRSYDPSVSIPDEVRLIHRLAEAASPEILNVMVVE